MHRRTNKKSDYSDKKNENTMTNDSFFTDEFRNIYNGIQKNFQTGRMADSLFNPDDIPILNFLPSSKNNSNTFKKSTPNKNDSSTKTNNHFSLFENDLIPSNYKTQRHDNEKNKNKLKTDNNEKCGIKTLLSTRSKITYPFEKKIDTSDANKISTNTNSNTRSETDKSIQKMIEDEFLGTDDGFIISNIPVKTPTLNIKYNPNENIKYNPNENKSTIFHEKQIESISEPKETVVFYPKQVEPVITPKVESVVVPVTSKVEHVITPKVEPVVVSVTSKVEHVITPKVEPVIVPVTPKAKPVTPTVTPRVEHIVVPTVASKVEPVVMPVTSKAKPVTPAVTPRVEHIVVPQVEPVIVPQVEPVIVPQVEPVVVPQVESVIVPQVEPVVFHPKQVEPVIVPQVEPVIVSQVEPVVVSVATKEEPMLEIKYVPKPIVEIKPVETILRSSHTNLRPILKPNINDNYLVPRENLSDIENRMTKKEASKKIDIKNDDITIVNMNSKQEMNTNSQENIVVSTTEETNNVPVEKTLIIQEIIDPVQKPLEAATKVHDTKNEWPDLSIEDVNATFKIVGDMKGKEKFIIEYKRYMAIDKSWAPSLTRTSEYRKIILSYLEHLFNETKRLINVLLTDIDNGVDVDIKVSELENMISNMMIFLHKFDTMRNVYIDDTGIHARLGVIRNKFFTFRHSLFRKLAIPKQNGIDHNNN